MSEKIRGAIFNSLGDIQGKSFLDAYAGTGAIAIEALSRGAVNVHAVEILPDSFKTLKENRDLVTVENELKVHRANVVSWSKNQNEKFDIIVADPPYDEVKENQLIEISDYVNKGGILVLSLPPKINIKIDSFEILSEKLYGDAKLLFLKRVN